MSDLARKLGLAPGRSVCLLDAPAPAVEVLRAACPPDVALALADRDPEGSAHDLILFWPRTLDGLSERLARLQARITPDGALWVVMPKKAHATARGIAFTWDQMQAAALRTDLVDNKVASFSDTDYATRFVIRKDQRAAYRTSTNTTRPPA